MSLLRQLALGATSPVYTVDDVFCAYPYAAINTAMVAVTGVDLLNKGGLLWTKCRDRSQNHVFSDTIRGVSSSLLCNLTLADQGTKGLTSFNNNGFTFANGGDQNTCWNSYASWSFAQAPKFFKMAQVVVAGSNQTVDLASLGTVGMVIVKSLGTGNWYTWHRSLTAGNLLYFNDTRAPFANASISVSGTTLTLNQAAIGNGTFMVYAWAHDTSPNGMIYCSVFTTDGSGNATITLPWEAQFCTIKDASNGSNDWLTQDTARGMSLGHNQFLFPNGSGGESSSGAYGLCPTTSGINCNVVQSASTNYIFWAIRKGATNKPTIGTQVFTAINRTGTGTTGQITGVGFPPDIVLTMTRTAGYGSTLYDRLRGGLCRLQMNTTGAEAADTDSLLSFTQDGVMVGPDTSWGSINGNTLNSIDYFLRRYPYVVDEISYTGTAASLSVPHALISAPELWFVKNRTAGLWSVGSTQLGTNGYLVANTTAAKATSASRWDNIYPTSSVLNLGLDSVVNSAGNSFFAILFATLAGISKVGSYTGNGGSQTINCGFTTGARFVLIKRTDAAGDWYVWDTVRGIISANDPHLSLNGTASEVGTDDSLDPDSTGFIVNQLAATNINVTSATYLYLALA